MRLSNYIILIVFFIFPNFIIGQLTKEMVTEEFKKIEKKISIGEFNQYYTYNKDLKKLENKVVQNKDTLLLLHLYHLESVLFINNLDYANARNIVTKRIAILKKKPILSEFGRLYNCLFILEKKTIDKIKYLKLAGNYIKKYGTLSELNDFYINEYRFYRTIMYYSAFEIIYIQKSLQASLKSLYPLQKLKNEEYLLFQLTNIVNCYILLNDYRNAQKYLEQLESVNAISKYKINNEPYLNYQYNTNKAILLEKNDKVRQLVKESQYAFDKNFIKWKSSFNKVNENYRKNNEEFKKNLVKLREKENEVYKKNIISNIFIFIIIILLVIGFFLYKNFRDKAKINSQLQEVIESKTKFLNNITHELKTPLNTVKSVSYLLLSDKEKVDHNLVELINFSNNHLLNLINDIIGYNQNKDSKFLNNFSHNLNIKNVINYIYHSVLLNSNNGNKLELIIDEAIPENLYFDEKKISQILFNLLNNSMKFTIDGKIELVVKLMHDHQDWVEVYFEVNDTGVGISKEAQSKIFNINTQENETINQKFGGTGFGLFIVKEFVEDLGGEVKLESEVNLGTKISFLLQFKKNFPKTVNFPSELVEKQKILLVEDNKINQLLIKKIIEKTGNICDTADNGLEAIELLNSNQYSVIFMDLMMPVMDGFEATKIINERYSFIPIVVLSAISDELNKQKLEDLKILKFLSKPVNTNELYDIINTVQNKLRLKN